MHGAVDLAHRALDFRVPGVADQNDVTPGGHVILALQVHLGHERAGGIEHSQAARLCFLFNDARHAMGTENSDRTRGGFGQLVDEARALGLERIDHMLVVDDLMAHVDRGAVFFQGAFHDLDGTYDTRTKTAGLGKEDLHSALRLRSAGMTVPIEVACPDRHGLMAPAAPVPVAIRAHPWGDRRPVV